jgi:hypothetical protein
MHGRELRCIGPLAIQVEAQRDHTEPAPRAGPVPERIPAGSPVVEVDRVLTERAAFGFRHVQEACQVAPLVAPPTLAFKIDMCSDLVGMAGFEPAASCSQSRRANQAAPHPAEPIRSLPLSVLYLPRRDPRVGRSAMCPLPRPSCVNDISQQAWRRFGLTVTLPVRWRCSPRRRNRLRAGRAGVAQWQSPSLPSWS